MTRRVQPAHAHRRMPWKNGRGETVEVAVWPETAGLDDFGWRVSMAGVTEDGAFSIFAQVDRTLAVLTGDGLELQVQGLGLHRLTPGSAPLAFPADAPCAARLIGAPVSDLNAMTRRGAFQHRMARATDPGLLSDWQADWLIALATQPVALELGGEAVTLEPLDALICDGPEAALPLPPAPGLWLIGIHAAP